MDSTYPPEAWKRLGKVLEARRGELGYGFRQREQFLRDRGGPPPSVKMIARLERGERTSYPASTVTLLESLYGYRPGSFEAVLNGGEPADAAAVLRILPVPDEAPPGDDMTARIASLAKVIYGQSGKEVAVMEREFRAALRALGVDDGTHGEKRALRWYPNGRHIHRVTR